MHKKENDPAIAGSLLKFLLLAEIIVVRKIIVVASASVITGADTSNFFTRVKIFVIAVPFVPIGIGICSWFYDFSKKIRPMTRHY
jgi:hypothetical protein